MVDDIEITKRIEQIRSKLLDLTTSNKMLSYKHPKVSCLRIVDELPEVVFGNITRGISYQFKPVQLPTSIEIAAWSQEQRPTRVNQNSNITRPDPASWAAHLGIDVSFELKVQSDDFDLDERHTDKFLQTLHYPDELESRLRRLRSASRSAIEETGSNMLYLSFGFLEWTEGEGARSHQAPLILVPVTLNNVIQGGREKISVNWNGDEIQANLSLAKKLDEFGIVLPEIEEDTSVENYLRELTLRIRGKAGWRVRRYVTLGLFDFGKIVLYNDLDPSRWPSHCSLETRPLVKRILMAGERGSNSAEGRGISIESAKRFDLELPLIDRADSSQCIALESVLSGNNLVIEGPPGTGKSQTITNLIACAMNAGKSVLFVAEKLEALDVVRRRLRELGLGIFCLELHSAKTRKTSVLEDISQRLLAETQFRSNTKTDSLSHLASRREQLAQYLDIISKSSGAMRINVHQTLMRAGAARSKIGNDARRITSGNLSIKSAQDVTPVQFFESLSRIERLQRAFSDLGISGPAQHPWRGVSSREVLPNDADKISSLAQSWGNAANGLIPFTDKSWIRVNDQIIQGLMPALHKLNHLKHSIQACEYEAKQIENTFSLKLKRDNSALQTMMKLKDLFALHDLKRMSFDKFAFEESAISYIEKAIDLSNKLTLCKPFVSEVFKPSALELSVTDCEDLAVPFSKKGIFNVFTKSYRIASSEWVRLCRPKYADSKKGKRVESLGILAEYLDIYRQLNDGTKISELKGYIEGADIDTLKRISDTSAFLKNLSQILNVSLSNLKVFSNVEVLERVKERLNTECANHISNLLDLNIKENNSSFWKSILSIDLFKPYSFLLSPEIEKIDWPNLLESGKNFVSTKVAYLEAEAEFIRVCGLDRDSWFSGRVSVDFAHIAQRALSAAEHPNELGRWLAFDQSLSSTKGQMEEPLVKAVIDGDLDVSKLKEYLNFALYDSLARSCFSSNPQLLQFSRVHLDQLRSEYRNIDAEVMEVRRIETAAKLYSRKPIAGVQSGLKSQLTEMAFLRNEMTKKARFRPIRELMRRSGRSIQALKPCFMMGPISAAQYIEPGTLNFDLIVIDEASQMRPEDALGALARGGQAVIVGDPKQLPPTSFFDRSSSGDDQDDDELVTLAEDSKSILDLGSNLFDSHMLKFHYRSRHESLIAFSNSRFYRNELIVFPSPKSQSDELGIGWNFISDGTAASGLNVQEARAVAKFVASFVKNQRGRSIGVVAMNVKQAEQIENEIEILKSRDPELRDRFAALEDMAGGEDFFVKNLERVQGDQRDVIVISMTYGPIAVGGKTPQNFGPVNQENGWRRLNVLFTRAKDRMEIFSSMRSMDIVPKSSTDSGPDALKAFLEYAETGRLGQKVSVTDSETNEFEDSIQHGLESLGYKCVPQVGVGSYRIDLAIEDPDRPSTFIAGIECDGATYHSSRSARDRDRIRQEILEGLGWSILRIWSTDWFRDSESELARIDSELKELFKTKNYSFRNKSTEEEVNSVLVENADFEGTLGQDNHADPEMLPLSLSKKSVALISLEEARQKLISLREVKLKSLFPDSDPSIGFLRKSMLDELLTKRPLDMEEFRAKISLPLREKTEGSQVQAIANEVFDLLSQIR